MSNKRRSIAQNYAELKADPAQLSNFIKETLVLSKKAFNFDWSSESVKDRRSRHEKEYAEHISDMIRETQDREATDDDLWGSTISICEQYLLLHHDLLQACSPSDENAQNRHVVYHLPTLGVHNCPRSHESQDC